MKKIRTKSYNIFAFGFFSCCNVFINGNTFLSSYVSSYQVNSSAGRYDWFIHVPQLKCTARMITVLELLVIMDSMSLFLIGSDKIYSSEIRLQTNSKNLGHYIECEPSCYKFIETLTVIRLALRGKGANVMMENKEGYHGQVVKGTWPRAKIKGFGLNSGYARNFLTLI